MHGRGLVALAFLPVHQLDEIHEDQGELRRHVGAVVEIRVIDLIEPFIQSLLDDDPIRHGVH